MCMQTARINEVEPILLLLFPFFFSDICLTTDLDLFMHMNNARYLRDCDIARIKLWAQSGVWLVLRKLGGSLTLGGSTVRYRKEINLFTTYDIKTKVIQMILL